MDTKPLKEKTENAKHVVIVGGGFAGLNCARRLASHPNVRITLIDRNNFQQFQPLLYQVATSMLTPNNAAFVLRNLFKRRANVDVKMGEVVSVDLDTRTATTLEGQTYQGDYLVLATGSQVNFFGTPGADLHAYPLYSLHDAELLRSVWVSPPGHGGRIDVEPDFSVKGRVGVYALGDFANIRGKDGKFLPQLASVAEQSGKLCAKNIAAAIEGRPGKAFHYFDKGIMAMIGRNAAVAEVGEHRHELHGPIAFAAWLGVHVALLATLRAKMDTFLEWAWDYFGKVQGDSVLDRPEQMNINWSDTKERRAA